jgi:hypothetical protein
MGDLLGADYGLVEIHALYRCLDKLVEHKAALFDHLRQRWQDLFGAGFEVLLYDLTSTYFESPQPDDEDDKRRYGYSRDKRSDCTQVVIALIVTPDGFPLAYEVLPGNTADCTTLGNALRKIEAQYCKAQRIWIMDRGIPTEEVLAEMRQADPPVSYLVGTPKGRLSKLEKALLRLPWQAVREGVDVKLLPQEQEMYVLAQSHARINKERAMRGRKLKWLWARLKQIAAMEGLTREELLMKLGAARQSQSGMASDRCRSGAQGRHFQLRPQSRQAAKDTPPRGALSAAHQSVRPGSGQAVEVLYPARRGRGRVQESQGRSATPSDLSPA